MLRHNLTSTPEELQLSGVWSWEVPTGVATEVGCMLSSRKSGTMMHFVAADRSTVLSTGRMGNMSLAEQSLELQNGQFLAAGSNARV